MLKVYQKLSANVISTLIGYISSQAVTRIRHNVYPGFVNVCEVGWSLEINSVRVRSVELRPG